MEILVSPFAIPFIVPLLTVAMELFNDSQVIVLFVAFSGIILQDILSVESEKVNFSTVRKYPKFLSSYRNNC